MNAREVAEENLKRYKDWSPTGFDAKGLRADDLDRGEWFVAPVMRTRDSGPLAESNFQAALEELGGESETVEVHRFGHWGPGWFEIILAHPDHAKTLGEIVGALANYPILDEHDYSEREWTAAESYWRHCSLSERVQMCADAGISIFAARSKSIPRADPGDIFEHCRPEEY